MNCAECREQLVAYVEGLLDEPERQVLDDHVQDCAACRGELDAVTQLHERLVTGGKAYANEEAANVVMTRILREQQFKLRRVHQARDRIALRRLIMSRFGRLAVAAVAVVAIGLGIFLFQQTESISLAEVLERVKMAKAFSYHMQMTMVGVAGMKEPMEGEIQAWVVQDHGMRLDSAMTHRGQTVMTQTFLLIAEDTVVTVVPQEKKYMKIHLTGDYIEEKLSEARNESANPEAMLEQFLEHGYTELGRSVIDGAEAEGFETTRALPVKMLGSSSVGRIWVAVESRMPVRIELESQSEDNSRSVTIVADGFEWDTEIAADWLTPEIPDDFEPIAQADLRIGQLAENLVKGLRLYVRYAKDRYPKELSMMDTANELGDLIKANEAVLEPGSEPDQEILDAVVNLQMGCTLYGAMAAEEDKDAAYYGETVKPGQADKVLVRWKANDGTYTVIFGDLRIEKQVSPQRLAELEQR